MNHSSGYQLGSGEDELARLELQGATLALATRMIFAAAGLWPGMRVLDLGCGAGDVAFAAARRCRSRSTWARDRATLWCAPGARCSRASSARPHKLSPP